MNKRQRTTIQRPKDKEQHIRRPKDKEQQYNDQKTKSNNTVTKRQIATIQ